jgi:uncharacterized protein (TIGR00730 family)
VPGPEKSYKNLSFLNGPSARHIRILCEYEEPRSRFVNKGVRDTIVIFGSARVKPAEIAAMELAQAQGDLAAAPPGPTHAHLEAALKKAERADRLSKYYEHTRDLARRLTEWSLSRPDSRRRYLVCSGGGPGIMEASNRGAADVPGGQSVGLGISLPMEERVNRYVTPDLGFEFHYFFMRKYWFAYLAKAMVIMPGGFGTMDELAEILTLRQTGKIKKPLPMVLFGTEYWNRVIDMDAMVEWGTISDRDLLLMHKTDSVDDAFAHITGQLDAIEREERR